MRWGEGRICLLLSIVLVHKGKGEQICLLLYMLLVHAMRREGVGDWDFCWIYFVHCSLGVWKWLHNSFACIYGIIFCK